MADMAALGSFAPRPIEYFHMQYCWGLGRALASSSSVTFK